MTVVFFLLTWAGVMGLISALVTWFLPEKSTRGKIGPKKLRKLEQQVPIFLNSVSSGLSAGSSLLQSLETANERTPPPMKNLVDGILTRVKAGMPLEKALVKSGEGLKRGSLLLALHSMAASYRSGSNMVQSLSRLAELCRERENLREKILAATAQSRMQGTVLILVPLFFMLMLFLASPENLREVLLSSLGRKLLSAAGLLQCLGMLIIRRMLKKEIL